MRRFQTVCIVMIWTRRLFSDVVPTWDGATRCTRGCSTLLLPNCPKLGKKRIPGPTGFSKGPSTCVYSSVRGVYEVCTRFWKGVGYPVVLPSYTPSPKLGKKRIPGPTGFSKRLSTGVYEQCTRCVRGVYAFLEGCRLPSWYTVHILDMLHYADTVDMCTTNDTSGWCQNNVAILPRMYGVHTQCEVYSE